MLPISTVFHITDLFSYKLTNEIIWRPDEVLVDRMKHVDIGMSPLTAQPPHVSRGTIGVTVLPLPYPEWRGRSRCSPLCPLEVLTATWLAVGVLPSSHRTFPAMQAGLYVMYGSLYSIVLSLYTKIWCIQVDFTTVYFHHYWLLSTVTLDGLPISIV